MSVLRQKNSNIVLPKANLMADWDFSSEIHVQCLSQDVDWRLTQESPLMHVFIR